MPFDAKAYRSRVLMPYTKGKEPILRNALAELKQNPQLNVPSQQIKKLSQDLRN